MQRTTKWEIPKREKVKNEDGAPFGVWDARGSKIRKIDKLQPSQLGLA